MNNLSLDLEVYNRSIILEAINAYRGLCVIDYTERGHKFICKFSKCKYNIDKTTLEFENYVIDLMNTQVPNENYN